MRSALAIRTALSSAAFVLLAAGPAQASFTIGDTTGATDTCGSNQVLVQRATAGPPSYAAPSDGVIVSWNYRAASQAPSIRLRVYHATADPTVWFTRSESPQKTGGTGPGQVHTNSLNTFPESPGITIKSGDTLGLTGSGASGMGCIDTTSNSDLIRVKNPPDPPVGQNSTASFLGELPKLKIGVSAVVEPDADGDGFGDESQDSCPTDATVHSGTCPVDVSIAKTASPNPKAGEALAYTLAVKNNHTANPASGVSVVDTLPSGVTFFAAAAEQGSCSGTTTVTCSLGTLAPGQTTNVTIIVTPSAPGMLSNTASVTTTASDTDTSNNSSTALSTVGEAVPVVSNFKLKPKSFVAATKGGSIVAAATTGTVVSYGLNTASTTTLTVQKPVPGVKSGKRCVKPPSKPPRNAKKCTRFVSLGSFKRAGAAGSVRFRYTGRLKGKTLAPGSYRLRAVARNVSGASDPVQAAFKVKSK